MRRVVHFVEEFTCVSKSRVIYLLKNLYVSERRLLIILKTNPFELEDFTFILRHNGTNLWDGIE